MCATHNSCAWVAHIIVIMWDIFVENETTSQTGDGLHKNVVGYVLIYYWLKHVLLLYHYNNFLVFFIAWNVQNKHILLRKEGPHRLTRHRCWGCYRINVAVFGSRLAKNKTNKVSTYCSQCPNKPYLCLSCFRLKHTIDGN